MPVKLQAGKTHISTRDVQLHFRNSQTSLPNGRPSMLGLSYFLLRTSRSLAFLPALVSFSSRRVHSLAFVPFSSRRVLFLMPRPFPRTRTFFLALASADDRHSLLRLAGMRIKISAGCLKRSTFGNIRSTDICEGRHYENIYQNRRQGRNLAV